MRTLTAADVLHIWERGLGQHPVVRALLILAVAAPDEPWEDLAALHIGQRDARLLALREQTLGAGLTGFGTCPACHEPLEFRLHTADLRREATLARPGDTWALQVDDVAVLFRLPNSRDLLAVADAPDGEVARQWLVQRCILRAGRGGVPIAATEMPPEVCAALVQRMAECDPLAEILLDLACAGCGHQWQEVLDPGTFFWVELAAQAQRLLTDVHTLAQAYGWREADILAMSDRRRQWYLEMVGA